MRDYVQRILKIARRAIWLVSKGLAIRVNLYEGSLAQAEIPFRCLTVSSAIFIDDFKTRIFCTEPRLLHTARVPFFLLSRYIRNHQSDFDLCVAALPSAYNFLLRSVATFEGPDWITQLIDTSDGWEGVRQRLSRAKRTSINGFERKYGLEMRISSSEEEVEFFYRRMFLPYVSKRFGSVAVVDTQDEILGFFRDGGMLMYIQKEGNPIAAALCQHKHGKLSYYRAGVLDGDEKILKSGALTAIYYFMIKYAIENHLHVLDAQQSRPFLKDGVFENKARWGASVVHFPRNTTSISYVCSGSNEKLAQLFMACPIVVNAGAALRAVIGAKDNGDPQEDELLELLREYHLAGICEAAVITGKGWRTISHPAQHGSARPATGRR